MSPDPYSRLREVARFLPHEVERKAYSFFPSERICGVDEAGRGPLAGPVVSCACVLPDEVRNASFLVDSKTLTERQILKHFEQIVAIPGLVYATAIVDHEQIDRINIYQATLLAMKQAVEALPCALNLVLVDGPKAPNCFVPAVPVIKGDAYCKVIGAASIIAKYTRDQLMREYDRLYPQYGFAKHKGYATPLHKKMILLHGVSPIHRKSFTISV